MRPIVSIGAGGFGREVIDVIVAVNHVAPTFELLGVVDDRPAPADLERLSAMGVEYLGSVDEFLERDQAVEFVIGIANPRARQVIDERMTAKGHTGAVLVHPSATQGWNVELGPGSIICAGARLTTNITIGRHVHVNLNSTIGHDATLRSYVTLFPAAAVSGYCVVEEMASMGVGSAVLQGLTVGRGAFVGASALVVKDVLPDSVVKGVPAR